MNASHTLLGHRYRDVAGVTLGDVLGRSRWLRTASPLLSRRTGELRQSLLDEMREGRREVMRTMAAATRSFLYSEYQYIEIDRRGEERLDDLYGLFTEEMAETLRRDGEDLGRGMERVLAGHHERLRSLVCSLLSACGVGAEGAQSVVCAEYSPALQRAVLGAHELHEPILDLGCGADAALVHHLRGEGYSQVIGLDRSVVQGTGLVAGSWFDHTFPPDTFGTVLAHLSFSLHFLHAHLRSAARAARFAEKYVEILASLKPGGRFLYTPGLPFIEGHLSPTTYRVTRHQVLAPAVGSVPEQLANPSATIVERLA